MSTTAIIQARMSSTRLPGKVLMDVAGRPMLAHVVERVSRCTALDGVVVATSTDVSDDPIVAFCRDAGVRHFRGSLDDVLDRFYRAAEGSGSDALVRITADCPMADPDVIGRVVAAYRAGGVDYASNVEPPTFPDGLDAEAFSFAALSAAWKEATRPADRMHVTPFIRENPDPGRFRKRNVTHEPDLSGLRWTVDEPRDMTFVRGVFEAFGHNRFSMDDALTLLKRKSELTEVNAGIVRNEGYRKDLAKEGRSQS